ncbi:MAG: hypothetical protein FIB08_04890 [Candidatus Methanoperedens sp.]|nr:hypothetical protein [Candidatus Methanoperedens sp.]
MNMKLIVVMILLVVLAAAGFSVLNYAIQGSGEKDYGEKTFNDIISGAKTVLDGPVGSKHIVLAKLPVNSKIILSNDIKNGAPAGRVDIELSNGNKLEQELALPINFLSRDRKETGKMRLDLDNQLSIDTSVSPQMEIFFPEGEYKFILIHRKAEYTSWSAKGTDYLEVNQE